MAKDVELALAGIGMKHGRMDEAEARKWLTRLREQGRYMKDVY
jgi:sulfite reductase alpha subunit-like flavoprotein